MNKFLRFCFLTFTISCASCSTTVELPPLVSGMIYNNSEERPLNQEQLTIVSNWLDQHRAGWRGIMATPPPTKTAIILQHTGGKTSTLEFYHGSLNAPGWSQSINLSSPSNEGILTQSFSEKDMQPLLTIIQK